MTYLMVFLIGFVALSQEVLWVRFLGYFTASHAGHFGLILGFFLLGVAYGALFAQEIFTGKRYFARASTIIFSAVAVILMVAGSYTAYLTSHLTRPLQFNYAYIFYVSQYLFFPLQIVLSLALISLVRKGLWQRGVAQPRQVFAPLFLLSALSLIVAPVLLAALAGQSQKAITLLAYLLSYPLVTINAFSLGGLLPLLSGLHIKAERGSGSQFANFYFLNILGGTCGSLVTGFYLLEYCSLQQTMWLCALCQVALALYTVTADSLVLRWRFAVVIGVGLLLPLLYWYGYVRQPWLEKLMFKHEYQSQRFQVVHENRQGIITVEDTPDHTIYGHGAYDGQIKVDLENNSNHIDRLLIPYLFAKPLKRVLFIGVSGGAWVALLAHDLGIQHIDAVEINPGYFEVIKKFPVVQPILQDARIHLWPGDGRHWLLGHRDRFDLIVMNTTYYWRHFSANLLSKEFFQLLIQHLRSGGMIAFNTTNSLLPAVTVAQVFPYVTVYKNFVYAANEVLAKLPKKQRASRLTPFFQENNKAAGLRHTLMELSFTNLHNDLQHLPVPIITDDNLASEFSPHAHLGLSTSLPKTVQH